jgi:isopenicillin-N epimerase
MRVVIVDHLTSLTALVLPLAEIAAACHQRGVLVLADGAHAPGALELDIDALGVDWYIANLHKWCWTPRSSGFVWVSDQWREYLRPTVTSSGLDHGLAAEFDLPGTRDPTPFLVAPTAIDLLNQWGGRAVLAHNHDLAWSSAHRLADVWGTTFDTPEAMIGPMASVALPPQFAVTAEHAAVLQRSLLVDDHIEVPIALIDGQLRLRISAQLYNEALDYDLLAGAITRRLP